MKKKRKVKNKPNRLVEVVVPFGPGASEDGLFDDCPLCLKLRAEMESGETETVLDPPWYKGEGTGFWRTIH